MVTVQQLQQLAIFVRPDEEHVWCIVRTNDTSKTHCGRVVRYTEHGPGKKDYLYPSYVCADCLAALRRLGVLLGYKPNTNGGV